MSRPASRTCSTRSAPRAGAFYHYFDSKAALLDAVVERMVEAATASVEPLVDDPSLTAVEKLEGVLAGIARWKGERTELVLAVLRVWLADDNAIVRDKVRRGIADALHADADLDHHAGRGRGHVHGHRSRPRRPRPRRALPGRQRDRRRALLRSPGRRGLVRVRRAPAGRLPGGARADPGRARRVAPTSPIPPLCTAGSAEGTRSRRSVHGAHHQDREAHQVLRRRTAGSSMSTSRSRPARSSDSSARTVPARRPRSGPSST